MNPFSVAQTRLDARSFSISLFIKLLPGRSTGHKARILRITLPPPRLHHLPHRSTVACLARVPDNRSQGPLVYVARVDLRRLHRLRPENHGRANGAASIPLNRLAGAPSGLLADAKGRFGERRLAKRAGVVRDYQSNRLASCQLLVYFKPLISLHFKLLTTHFSYQPFISQLI